MKQGRTVLEAKRFGCRTCYPETVLSEVVQQLVEKDISCLVVTDHDGYLAGIITRNDVLRDYLHNDDWQQARVGDYMTQNVITVKPDDSLESVANLLVDHRIHRVVVVREEEGKQKPVAVVSATDLIYHMLKEIR
jgi:CBS domain-containing protein